MTYRDDSSSVGKGYAYVSSTADDGQSWSDPVELAPDDGAVSGFGVFVSVFEDTVLVGAAVDVAYVFQRMQGGHWAQVNKIPGAIGALHDNIVVTGSKVFRTDDHWDTYQEVPLPKAGSTAVYGKTVVVGVSADNNGTGALYVFASADDGQTWHHQDTLTAPDATSLGSVVAISEDLTIVAKAAGEQAFVFKKKADKNSWYLAKILEGESREKQLPPGSDSFASAFDIANGVVVVGASSDADTRWSPVSGSAYVFHV